jgi:hypothetical protein
MKTAALVALALALPSGASAFDQPAPMTPTCTHVNFRVLEAVLPSILARSMRDSRNSESVETADFLDNHLGLNFRIAVDASQSESFPGTPTIAPTTVMAYSDMDQAIEVHHALLHLDDADEAKIIQDPARLERTVRRFWPSIVHETSHARTAHGPGRFVAAAVLDDEFFAFYREMFFVLEQLETEKDYLGIRSMASCARDEAAMQVEMYALLPKMKELEERKPRTAAVKRAYAKLAKQANDLGERQKAARKRCPGLAAPEGSSAVRLALFGLSSDAFEAEIRGNYESHNRLPLDAPDLIARANSLNEDHIRVWSDLLARFQAVHQADPSNATANEGIESCLRSLAVMGLAREFWNSPEKARQGVAEYKTELARIRARAQEKRERYQLVLKPFLP